MIINGLVYSKEVDFVKKMYFIEKNAYLCSLKRKNL